MAKKKSNKIISAFSIFFSSAKTYFLYLDQCFKYLSFPIFGQLIGLALIFTCTYYFNINKENISNISPFFENHLYTIFYIVLLPFFIIFVKAIYDYVLAFCGLNLLFYTVSNKKKVKDINFKANKDVIQRRLFQYILLMLLVSVLLVVPPLIFVAPIIWVFLCLSFQVFSFENGTSAFKAIGRSVELVKGNFIATSILLLLCGFTTYWFLPNVFLWACEKISVTSFLINKIELIAQMLPLNHYNDILSIVNYEIDALTIAKASAESVITFIVIGFSLPFRCCCFTELYKLYDSEKIKEFSKSTDDIIERATGKKRKN
ncbi:MAG: hypothetical protein IJY61_03080 [Candidatus Gastranaerophilales bacterium]|nr:hypothetical protein [Candidatus Gastranaerophilales bacterium]